MTETEDDLHRLARTGMANPHTIHEVGCREHHHILQLMFEGMRFIGSGLLVFPLGLLVSALLHEVLGLREEIAAASAFAVMLIVNFTLMRLFIFRAAGAVNRQLPRFLLISLTMRGSEYLLFLLLFRLAGLGYLVAMVAALATSSVIKFFLYRLWVFEQPLKSLNNRPQEPGEE